MRFDCSVLSLLCLVDACFFPSFGCLLLRRHRRRRRFFCLFVETCCIKWTQHRRILFRHENVVLYFSRNSWSNRTDDASPIKMQCFRHNVCYHMHTLYSGNNDYCFPNSIQFNSKSLSTENNTAISTLDGYTSDSELVKCLSPSSFIFWMDDLEFILIFRIKIFTINNFADFGMAHKHSARSMTHSHSPALTLSLSMSLSLVPCLLLLLFLPRSSMTSRHTSKVVINWLQLKRVRGEWGNTCSLFLLSP